MATYQFPTTLTPTGSTWTLVENTRRFSSPLTNATQTVSRKGTMWRVDLTFSNLTETDRGALQGFMAKLQGQVNRVRLKDHAFTRQGAGGGTPLINGASQTGSSVILDGVGTVPDYLKAGDLLAWDKVSDSGADNPQLHMCTDTISAVGGAITVAISPPLRNSPPNNAPVNITDPEGVFMLATDPQWNNRPGANIFSSFSMTFLQDVLS